MKTDKLIQKQDLIELRAKHPEKTIVFTCGCFDILHIGHLRYLKESAGLGDIFVIGLNTDKSIKALKGEQRPIVCEAERAEMLAAYDFVDYICLFEEDTPAKLLEALRPNIFTKGGDWVPEKFPSYDICKKYNIEVRFLQNVEDRSTTLLLEKMHRSDKKYKIAVIGDVALDLTYRSHRSEEYLDEPKFFAQYVDHVSYDAGGAGNLASDIAVHEDVDVDLYSYCGNDIWAMALKESLEKNHVHTDKLTSCDEMTTYVYHYFFDENGVEHPRHDIGCGNVHSNPNADRVIKTIAANIHQYDAVVLNEQFVSSIHDAYFKQKLSAILENVKVPIFLDCRHQVPYENCTLKINLNEARGYTGKTEPEECCQKLYEMYVAAQEKNNIASGKAKRYIIVSLGAKGALAYDGQKFTYEKAVLSDGQIFAVGAGDAFLAGLVYQTVKGSNVNDALKYANASGAACTKYLFQCGHPTEEDIQQLLDRADL